MALVTGAGKGVEGVEGTRARVEWLGRRCLEALAAGGWADAYGFGRVHTPGRSRPR